MFVAGIYQKTNIWKKKRLKNSSLVGMEKFMYLFELLEADDSSGPTPYI